ncbi:hypothetical protein KFL_013710010 [Klebsormidium nitens]|uniref:Retrovirus-related Pol polyprotein from transposon TNT 1-94-like beta-barrel domain-containing protein n=1 Tax=Klebsormidium nitens TaxID=105231 RepID=A0A1Y1IRA6_KLENI|nr:hypothetical protein KFL_013710010 [Klebsormidium nitens]|eukprot:GAQ93223.1 hypothetical protein KFL_013710010 [Klebsormidium nitens]
MGITRGWCRHELSKSGGSKRGNMLHLRPNRVRGRRKGGGGEGGSGKYTCWDHGAVAYAASIRLLELREGPGKLGGKRRELKPANVLLFWQCVPHEGKVQVRDAECRKCGKRGCTEAVCRQIARASGRAEERISAEDANGVAFTAWGNDRDVRKGVWIVDSGSTQHVTAERSHFTSYKELVRDEKIVRICAESLIAVGIGEMELK